MTAASTISDVARRAGVDRCTVSRVLNGREKQGRISAATADRVRRAASELTYAPNAAARALRGQKTWNIGVVVLDHPAAAEMLTHPGYAQSFFLIESICAARGYSLQLIRFAPDGTDSALTKISSRMVDGLILMEGDTPVLLDLCARMNIPCVEVMPASEPRLVCTVEADLIGGRLDALRRAAALGHERFMLIYDPRPRQRRNFEQLTERAASDPLLRGCRLTGVERPSSGGFANVSPIVAEWAATPRGERATVILAHEPVLMACLGEFAQHGVVCPRDVSLIGLSRSFASEATRPRLSAIENNVESVVRLAVPLLIDRIEAGRMTSLADAPALVPCRFVEGESFAGPS